MSRLIVYEPASVRQQYAGLAEPKLVAPVEEHERRRRAQAQAAAPAAQADASAAQADASAAQADASGARQDRDGYLSKLAKYVPAEMITIATLFFANFALKGGWVWFFVAIGAILNMLYLFSLAVQAGKSRRQPRPRIYFYPLSATAFVLWSLASIEAVASTSGLTIGQRAFILAFAAFLVPAVDNLFSVFDRPGPRS